MEAALAEYLRHLGVEKNASAYTVKSYREDLMQALEYFHTRLAAGTLSPDRLTTRLLRAYLAWLHEQGYAKTTIARRLAAVRSWCRFLCRQGVLETNPAAGLRGPRQDRKLPHFLSREEVERLLQAPLVNGPLGLRDRAWLETLYSAGLRVSELTGLDLADVDLAEGLATVRGKGKRERLALLGPPATAALAEWLEVRGAVAGGRGATRHGGVSQQEWHAVVIARALADCWSAICRRPAWTRAPARTPCGTASRRICSTPAPISAACRSCSGIAAWAPPRSTPMYRNSGCATVTTVPIPAPEAGRSEDDGVDS